MNQQLQAILNKGVEHMRKQRAKSTKSHQATETYCMYRSPAGMACFIGGCISDSVYSPDLEDIPACREEVREALEKSGFPNHNVKNWQLRKIQNELHDRLPGLESGSTPEEFSALFEAALVRVCDYCDLEVPKSQPTA